MGKSEIFPLVKRSCPFWGSHPGYPHALKRHKREFRKGRENCFWGQEKKLGAFFSLLHPEVFLIPRCSPIILMEDEYEVAFGPYRQNFPFSSLDFYTDWSKKGLFFDLVQNDALWRLGGISQLGYLVPPLDPEESGQTIFYNSPAFPHTRFAHSVFTAQLAEVILARNGFSAQERAPMVLTAGSHDIAMPAGGDSVIRINPNFLSEEKNYGLVLEWHGLAEFWHERYGFNVKDASSWVQGEGVFGHFLDIIDKMSYTAMDSFSLGFTSEGEVRQFCSENRLVMDVWQDLRFSQDRQLIFFVDPEKLFNFLLLRLLEHKELLYNARSRILDFFFTEYVGRLYSEEKVARDDLLLNDSVWLENLLAKSYPDVFGLSYLSPDSLQWKRFKKEEEALRFRHEINPEKIIFSESVKRVSTGLDWLVFHEGKIMPLRQALSPEKIVKLEEIVDEMEGWVVYYRHPK